jgi:hypothetical protein
MIKRTALILSAATLSFELALAPAAFAEDAMKKDKMSKRLDVQRLDEERQHVEGFDVQRQTHVEGQREKGRDEEELSHPGGLASVPGVSATPLGRQCPISCSRCSPAC